MFTNDNPLNSSDPLGLQGSAGLVAAQHYRNEVAKKCDGHPNRDGCRGIDVIAVVEKGGKIIVDVAGSIPGRLTSAGAIVGGALTIVSDGGKKVVYLAADVIGGIVGGAFGSALGATAGGAVGAKDGELSCGPDCAAGGAFYGAWIGGIAGGYEGGKIVISWVNWLTKHI